jgi:hypothetical protein
MRQNRHFAAAGAPSGQRPNRWRLGAVICRLAFVLAACWLIWGVWRPVTVALPDDLVRVSTPNELADLSEGREFLIQGTVRPLDEDTERRWLGRFAFVRKAWMDRGGRGSSKHLVLETIEDHRPAVRFGWAGGVWTVGAESYQLEYATPVVPRIWPRRAWGFESVDTWDRRSTGIRAGDSVLAWGHVDAIRQPVVTSFLRVPLESVVAQLEWQNVARGRLTLAAKIVLTIMVGSLLWPTRERKSSGGVLTPLEPG